MTVAFRLLGLQFRMDVCLLSITSDVGTKNSCRSLFKKLDIVPVSCQYMLSLMMFVVDNQNFFQTNSSVHELNARNKDQLYFPITILSFPVFK